MAQGRSRDEMTRGAFDVNTADGEGSRRSRGSAADEPVRLGEDLEREVFDVRLVFLRPEEARGLLRRLELTHEQREHLAQLGGLVRDLHPLLHRVQPAVVRHLRVRLGHLVRALQERQQRFGLVPHREREKGQSRAAQVPTVPGPGESSTYWF